jgi:hypothetical protein
MDKENVPYIYMYIYIYIYAYYRALFGHEEEWIYVICRNMDGAGNQNVK